MLLSLLTFGIGLIWVIPYRSVTLAKFYEDIKKNAAASGSGDAMRAA